MGHKLKSVKVLRENVYDLGLSKKFLHITSNEQFTKEKIELFYFINIENFCYDKSTLKRIFLNEPQFGKNICISHI